MVIQAGLVSIRCRKSPGHSSYGLPPVSQRMGRRTRQDHDSFTLDARRRRMADDGLKEQGRED